MTSSATGGWRSSSSRSRSRRRPRCRRGIRPFPLLLLLAAWGCAEESFPPDPRTRALERLTLVRPAKNRGGKPFFLDRFEVTRRLFGAWQERTVPERQAALPVVAVTPARALEFARWRGMRLPLLGEWEAALGIGPDRADSFPWGKTFDLISWDELKCNTAELGLGHLAPVGVFELGATEGTGIYDLVGNAAEWVVRPPEPGGTVLPARIRLFFLRRFTDRILQGSLAERVDRALVMALFHFHAAPLLLEKQDWLTGARPWLERVDRLLAPFRLPGLGEIRAALREEDRTMARLLTGPLSPLHLPVRLRELPRRFTRAVGLSVATVELARFLPAPFCGAQRLDLDKLFRLSLAEWEAIERPFAAAGWDYTSSMEQVGGGGISGRLSDRMGHRALSSTVGFRCAAYPEELLAWLAGPGGPSLEGSSRREVSLFLARYRDLFTPLAEALGRGGRPGRIRKLLGLP